MSTVPSNDPIVKRESLPKAIAVGELQLAGLRLRSAVLDNGERILGQEDFLKAIGRAPKAKGHAAGTVDQLPAWLAADNLKPFISSGLNWSTIHYRTADGRGGQSGIAKGYRAELLMDVCDIYLDAREAGVLRKHQLHIAAQCRMLNKAFSRTGIRAMVDEATGYQRVRPDGDLSSYFHLILGDILRPYEKLFHERFWKALHRLERITGPWHQHPPYFASVIRELVYDALAPGLANYLSANKPKSRSRKRWHQWLKDDSGVQMLKQHIESVTFLANACTSLTELRDRVKLAANVRNAQLLLFLPGPIAM